MKERIINLLKEEKGNISLFSIVLIMTLIANGIACLQGAWQTERVVLSASAGTVTLILLESLGDAIGMYLCTTSRPGILAIVTGTLVAIM